MDVDAGTGCYRARWALVVAGLAGVVCAAPVRAAEVAYFGVATGNRAAYLIDWQSGDRARVVAAGGVQPGSVSRDGEQRVVALSAALSTSAPSYDSCGQLIELRKDVWKLVVRQRGATQSELVEIGETVNVGGCQNGLRTPFGSPTAPGSVMARLPMAQRPPVDDLVPGTQIAGFADAEPVPGEPAVAQDVSTYYDTSVLFRSSSYVAPSRWSGGWLVLTLPGRERAYTRVAVDHRTQGESWLLADWSNEQPVSVEAVQVVQPVAGASFGSVPQASRQWESGMFLRAPQRAFFWLYEDGTGERVSLDRKSGLATRAPIDLWGLVGGLLLQTRRVGSSTYQRTWEPLRASGPHRWVLESEVILPDGGLPRRFIPPRVNLYLDRGPASAP